MIGSIAADDVYIGRPSPLGNPFRIGNDGTREQVVAKYEVWLRGIKDTATPQGTAAREALRRIQARVLQGERVHLVCYCAPRPCHGDVIKHIIETEGV